MMIAVVISSVLIKIVFYILHKKWRLRAQLAMEFATMELPQPPKI